MSLRAVTLGDSLRLELESISQREQLDHLGRFRWLRDQLENYLDRWLAFAAVESIPMKSLLKDDLFTMTLVASDILGQQLALNAQNRKMESWDRFNSMLLRVSKTKDRAALVELRPALDAVKVELEKKPKGV